VKDKIAQVEEIRAHNNQLWCSLLRIALASNPAEARRVLRAINTNDSAITRLLKEVADEPR